ncbi:carbonic anhydrase [Niallia sp. Krafla_26]|uniref:carbonic anhydrase n=1 Tax=Niallia sp. Krafla_26 TaxID=3064703 RepID=UPI003D179296
MKKIIFIFTIFLYLMFFTNSIDRKTVSASNLTPIRINDHTDGSYISSINWSYKGKTGPMYWSKLDSTYKACSKGMRQSPINFDLSKVKKVKGSSLNLHIHYQPTTVNVTNTGSTIQAEPITDYNRLVLNGHEYFLQQFHFHTPSEHTLNGQHQELELHLVHQDKSGKLAVVGVFINEGAAINTLNSIWGILPEEKTKEAKVVNHPIHLNHLLPEDPSFFYYEGSLTTPPCTEGVQWVVFKKPIEMSKSQIQSFQEIFPYNSRPIQPINNRDIFMKK